jgi:prenyltransferase beta subunit
MLQVARLAPNLLQESADRVAEYLLSQFNEDGGARDRAGKSDLYYTVFALDGLIALRKDPPVDRVRPWLESFGDGEGLDLVHLACLARCRAAAGLNGRAGLSERIGRETLSTVYHHFMAAGAIEDLGGTPSLSAGTILKHQSPDGSFGGTTPTTAGAVTALHHLRAEVPPKSVDWLLARARPEGGFAAVPDAPMPDLLSTATALHALTAAHASTGPIREKTLDFVDSLWTGQGFCGTWADEWPDCEYTFYGLLSLGHLSLE